MERVYIFHNKDKETFAMLVYETDTDYVVASTYNVATQDYENTFVIDKKDVIFIKRLKLIAI